MGFPWSLISTSLYALPSESYHRLVFIFPSASNMSTDVFASPYGPGFLLTEVCFEDGVTSISFPKEDLIVFLPLLTETLYSYNYPSRCLSAKKRIHFQSRLLHQLKFYLNNAFAMPLLRKGKQKALFQTDRRKGVGASLCGDIVKYDFKDY